MDSGRVDRVQRRRLVVGLAFSLVAPQRSSAQQTPVKIPRVGILTQADNERTPILDGFRAGLRDLGYVEGRNLILEFRFAKGDLTRGLELAAELVNIPVDVIVTEGVPAATDPRGHVPIVGPALMNPVERGFAVSLARPGRNITGFTLMHTELNGKRLQLLRTTFLTLPRSAL
jgi:putative ABC transport system substrate-binding protein